MTVLWRALILTSLASLPACDFYLGDDDNDDDDDDECIFVETPGYPVEQVLLRDPYTAECIHFGGGGGGGGYYECDGDETWPAPGGDRDEGGSGASEPGVGDAQAPPPSWGMCESECSALDEGTCLTTAGCQAAYVDECPADGECGPNSGSFYECWQVGQGYAPDVPCAQIADAESCGSRDDCAKIHYPLGGGDADAFRQPVGSYATCAEEPSDTGVGQCYGVPSCDLMAPSCPSGTIAGHDGECWTGFCIPVADCEPPPACSSMATEAQCVSQSSCTPIYEGNNCTCNGLDCTCADWDFVRCE